MSDGDSMSREEQEPDADDVLELDEFDDLLKMNELVGFDQDRERFVLLVEFEDPEKMYYAMHALNNDLVDDRGKPVSTLLLDGVVSFGARSYRTEFGVTHDFVLRQTPDRLSDSAAMRSAALKTMSELGSGPGRSMRPTLARNTLAEDSRFKTVEEICRECLDSAPPYVARYKRDAFMRWMNKQLADAGLQPFSRSPGPAFWEAVRRAVPSIQDDDRTSTQPQPITGVVPRPGCAGFPTPMKDPWA